VTSGPSIIQLLDDHGAEHEFGALRAPDARAIARFAESRGHTTSPAPTHTHVRLQGSTLSAAALSLRRLTREAFASRDGRGLIHCYSWRAARAARLAFGRTRPIILSVGEEYEEPRSLLGVSGPDRVLAHGVERSGDVVPLAPLCTRGSGADRAALRRAMGIADRDIVVGALAEPAEATNARWLVFFAGILVAGGLDLTILIPRSGSNIAAQIGRMRRFHATTRLSLRVIIVESGAEIGDDSGAWEACDVALVRPDAAVIPGIAPESVWRAIRRSHLLGVPVIAPRSLTCPALYPASIDPALVVEGGTTKQMARALTALIEDRVLRVAASRTAEDAARGETDESVLAGAIRDAYAPAMRGLLTGRSRQEGVA
jgi:hypothetical protein